MAGSGRQAITGTEKALEMLRTLPRFSLANIKDNPKAFKRVRRIFLFLNLLPNTFIF